MRSLALLYTLLLDRRIRYSSYKFFYFQQLGACIKVCRGQQSHCRCLFLSVGVNFRFFLLVRRNLPHEEYLDKLRPRLKSASLWAKAAEPLNTYGFTFSSSSSFSVVLFSSFSSILAAGFRPMRRAERDGLRLVRLDSSPPHSPISRRSTARL